MQQNRKRKSYTQEQEQRRDSNKPKIVKRNYHVTAQSAYNIRKLAMENNTSEGRIIDKLIRNYLACRGSYST